MGSRLCVTGAAVAVAGTEAVGAADEVVPEPWAQPLSAPAARATAATRARRDRILERIGTCGLNRNPGSGGRPDVPFVWLLLLVLAVARAVYGVVSLRRSQLQQLLDVTEVPAINRGARIRTGDLRHPKAARYQAAPRPVGAFESI